LIREALETARGADDATTRFIVLDGIVPWLSGAARAEAIDDMLRAVKEIEPPSARLDFLGGLPTDISAEQFQSARDLAQTLAGHDDYARIMGSLSSGVPSALLPEVLADVSLIGDWFHQSSALLSIAVQLTNESRLDVLDDAMKAAARIEEVSYRLQALASLALQLPPSERDGVLSQACALADQVEKHDFAYFEAISILARALGEERRQHVVDKALAATKLVQSSVDRCWAIARLSRVMSREQLATAAAIALGTHDVSDRARALHAIACHLPPGEREPLLDAALENARAIPEADRRARWLEAIGNSLPAERQQKIWREALAAAYAAEKAEARAKLLASLAPHFAAEERNKILGDARVAAREIKSDLFRAESFAVLASECEGDDRDGLLRDAITAALAIDDPRYRSQALASIVGYATPPLYREMIDRMLQTAPECGREDVLVMIGQSAPIIGALAGSQGLLETRRAIKDVVQWFP
jgi:hypothetical protein